jgi:hypothetical protein
MKLRALILGATLFSTGTCYGTQLRSAAERIYTTQQHRDSVLIERTVEALHKHPEVVQAYVRSLAPSQRQELIYLGLSQQGQYLQKALKEQWTK